MKLWVRSQDKENLVKVNNLSLVFSNKDEACEIINSFEDHQSWELGTYKSKERALEVLDEIQKYINNNCEFIEQKTHTKMGTYTNKIDTNVYQMPEE